MARIAHTGPIHLGLDVHRDTISVASLLPDQASAAVEQIPSDETAVLAFLGRFAEPARLRVCYEAGPTGKGGVLLLGRALAVDWAPHGINVNVVGPRVTATAMNAAFLADPA